MYARLPVALIPALALLAGCSTVRVDRAEGPSLFGAWRDTAVSSRGISPRSWQVLHDHDLHELYPDRLPEACDKLHAVALREPRAEVLFALAEMHYFRGEKGHAESYVLAAGYAWHYLLADAPPGEEYDPRFRLACDLYNTSLGKAIETEGETVDFRRLEGEARPKLAGFAYGLEDMAPARLCSAYRVTGLASHHRTYGLGVPLIAKWRKRIEKKDGPFRPTQATFPATAVMRFDGGLAKLRDGGAARLELINPLTEAGTRVGSRVVPLEADLTTPLAYYLAQLRLEAAGYQGFLKPDSLGGASGLHALTPYQPGKIPVVLVHGLLSSPMTWATMFNDLQADPEVRRRYQFWFYFYPSGNPYLVTAAMLRADLHRARQAIDPEGRDPALRDMVFVGHSMGGLVSRLMTVDGGDDFWGLVSEEPLGRLRLRERSREELRRTYYFERDPCVTRAVFLATPHRGSKISPSIVGRIGSRLAGLPKSVVSVTRDLTDDNPHLGPLFSDHTMRTSVDLLDPESPALRLIAHRPKPRQVSYHTIAGVSPRSTLIVERLLGGGYQQKSDGVVPYASAHIEGADSELIVDADHFTVHHHPLAIREVKRILMLHAAK